MILQEGSIQHVLIEKEAMKRGAWVEPISTSPFLHAYLQINNYKFSLKQGIIEDWLNPGALKICDAKQKTKGMLKILRLPHPVSYVFNELEDIDSNIFNGKRKFVCKPELGTNGNGVTFDIFSIQDVQKYLDEHKALGPKHLLEEFVEGKDLRLQIIGGRIVAACIRVPAYIVCDGKSSVQSLISASQKIIKAQNPANNLIVDNETLQLLKAQHYKLQDIPEQGVSILLKRIANMGQGAKAVDCTESYDPVLQKWVQKISSFLKCDYFALDIISKDIADAKQCKILEINAKAEWLHHTFSTGKQHDIAAVILDELVFQTTH